jgi:hypothetical protein
MKLYSQSSLSGVETPEDRTLSITSQLLRAVGSGL